MLRLFHRSRRVTRPHLRLIALIGLLVPQRLRAEWRQEWETELACRQRRLSAWCRGDARDERELLRRSTSAFWDALWLQRKRLEEDVVQDLRYGVRMLVAQPGFTVVAVLTLALGIGANTAIFTLADKVLIRALPVERPAELVTLARDGAGAPIAFSYPMYADLRDRQRALSGLAAYFQQPFSLSDGVQTERLIGQIVSGNYFAVAGVSPALGRFFLPDEDRTPGAHPVAVISDALWRRRFGADPAVLGKSVSLNGLVYTIVGVTPQTFVGTLRGTVNDVYVPMMMQAQAQPGRNNKLADRHSGWLRVFGRLGPGVTRSEAQASLTTVMAAARAAFPDATDPAQVTVVDGRRGQTDRVTDLSLPLRLLMGAVGLVLLIACANVANLLLVRGAARRREMAVRRAVGAGHWRIVRQLLTESTLLAVLGGAGGLVFATWLTGMLAGFRQPNAFVPRTFDGSLDGRVLWFTFGLSLLVGTIFGLIPALQAHGDAAPLQGRTATAGRSRRHRALRSALVVAQVALAVVVLVGAGLCVKSLRALQSLETGLEPAKVATMSFDLSLNGYTEPRGLQVYRELLARVATLPGVEAVSLARITPFSGAVWTRSATLDGYQPQPDERMAFDFNAIGPDYFRTVGTSIVRGREFTIQDAAGAPPVVIVNEATARRYWPGDVAVGRRLRYGAGPAPAEVIGVVADSKEKSLIDTTRPAIFSPVLQSYAPDMTLHVRSATDVQRLLAAVRRELQAIDPALPVYNLQTLADQKDGSLYNARVAAALLSLFAVLALLVSAIGIYGVLSYVVAERTHEMGIRLAYGALPSDLLRLVLRQGMTLALLGAAIGIGGALALTRLMAVLLFAVSPTDPLTFTAIPILLAGVALLACWIPARRATRMDPLTALRHE
jgi:predicted permease